jgi:exodeoxyribonuclease VII small subunit
MDSQSRTFEDAFGQLQQAIERLEQGGLPLAEALTVFEQSMRLAGDCHRILDQAELRLTRLVEEQVGELGESDEA